MEAKLLVCLLLTSVAISLAQNDFADTDGIPTPEPFCFLPADPGPCEALIVRWYFNSTSGECEQFTYGGCEGNENNFETRVECQRACRTDCEFVDCFVNPCDFLLCDGFPDALCVPDFCTDCEAFFVGPDGRIVECEDDRDDICGNTDELCTLPATTSEAATSDPGSLEQVWLECCDDLECCRCSGQVEIPYNLGTCQEAAACTCP